MAKTKLEQVDANLGRLHAARKIALYSRQQFSWKSVKEWTDHDENYKDVRRGPYHHVVEYMVAPRPRLDIYLVAPQPYPKASIGALQYRDDVWNYKKIHGTTKGAPHIEKHWEFLDSLIPKGVEPFAKTSVHVTQTEGMGPIANFYDPGWHRDDIGKMTLTLFEEEIGTDVRRKEITDDLIRRSGFIGGNHTHIKTLKRLICITPYLDSVDMMVQVNNYFNRDPPYLEGPLIKKVAPVK